MSSFRHLRPSVVRQFWAQPFPTNLTSAASSPEEDAGRPNTLEFRMPRLTYFSSRGLAEVPRLLLAETATAYEAVHLGAFKPGDQPPAFTALQQSGKLAFGMVPLWEEDDGLTLVQSDAIVRHLARTRGLYGDTAGEAARADMVAESVRDVRTEVAKLRFLEGDARAAQRQKLEKTYLPLWMERFQVNLQDSGLFGPRLSYADIAVWYLLENLADNQMPVWQQFPALQGFYGRIQDRPNLRRYLSSPGRFPAQPL